MTASPWSGRITLRLADRAAADRAFQALAPEAEREVPRARTRLSRSSGNSLEWRIRAEDTGAIRAAVNTHLGWLSLVRATDRVLHASGDAPRRE